MSRCQKNTLLMRRFLKFIHDDNVYCNIMPHVCRHTYCSNKVAKYSNLSQEEVPELGKKHGYLQ